MSGQKDDRASGSASADASDGASSGTEVLPSRDAEIEAALEQVRRMGAMRTGLDLPAWTGHEQAPLETGPMPAQASFRGTRMTTGPVRRAGAPEPTSMAPTPTGRAGSAEHPPLGGVAEAPREPGALGAPSPPGFGEPRPSSAPSGALMLTQDRRVLGPTSEGVASQGRPDPDALEALVTKVVQQELRAELRGELGLGLTRTIRKVARQEVNRLLAERELR